MSANDPYARTTTASGAQHLYVIPEACVLSPVAVPVTEAEVDGLLRLHYAGKFQPVHVELQAAILTPAARTIADDFALVYGLRLAAGDARPVPYAAGWVAARTELPRRTVRRSLDQLVRTGVLDKCPSLPPRGRRDGTNTFLPAGVAR